MSCNSFIKKVTLLWKDGHERSVNIKKNVVYTFLIKGLSVLSGFALIPLTIHYINPAQYGIWIIISTAAGWINTFDIGLSNGLRNRLAYAIAVGQKKDIIKYVSTTYILLFFVASAIFILFLVVNSFLDWNSIFNIQRTVDYDIGPVFLITTGAFCIQFILQPINTILVAIHQPFKSSLILLISQLLTLITIYILQRFTAGNLFIVVMVATGSPLIVLLLASIYLFNNGLKSSAPKFSFADRGIAKHLLHTGGAFFFLQIGALVVYETDNIIITRTLSPVEVTTFNIAYKYFSIITIIFTIIITPFWSAFTDAYAKKDYEWMRGSLKKMKAVWLVLSVMALILYLLSGIFYKIWIGDDIYIPSLLSLSLAINTIIQNRMNIYANMINGIGKLRVQLVLMVFGVIVNIPLSVFLIHKIGLAGTVVANSIVFMISGIFLAYQSRLLLNKQSGGIWDK
jgi:O-antigen/teichoic acid export membrane protein